MFSINIVVPRRWPGPWIRVIVVIVVYAVAVRQVPDAVVPLSLGGVLGSWLAASLTPATCQAHV